MKTLIIESPGKVTIRETGIPRPGEGEALLKMKYGGICGSDLNSYRGASAYVSYPRIPGHEFSAEIIEIEKNDRGLKPGMLVTGNPYFNCGTCYSCRRGLVNCCTANQTMGVQRDGAFSEYFTMPVNRLYGGKGLEARTLALIEPFCISYHGAARADIREGERILVVGAGTIGVLAAMAAKLRGARVWMTDISARKLALAEGFGIDGSFVNGGAAAFEEGVEKAAGGDGFDVAIEAVGLPSTFQNCIDAVAFGGRVVLIGVGKKNLDFNFTLLQKKELRVSGSRNALARDFLELIDLVKERRIPLDHIVTAVYPFAEGGRAFADFDKNAASMLKVVLEF
ncbi:MAG: zinc-binding alcohol dehydrogenase family protein [Treponema sp.]|nr:zinc-binding alcohol dehydrogenase family protein [Treponema sp.]